MNSKIFITTFVFLIIGVPCLLLAADAPKTYTSLVGIPGVTDAALSFGDYINALYALSITIAALMAVIKIIIAGMKYMLSDIVTSKSEALSDIQGAVFGLIIVLSAVLILTVINPQLTTTSVFLDKVVPVPVPAQPAIPPPTTQNESGYRYIKLNANPTAAKAFDDACLADKGKNTGEYNQSDGNQPYRVCYLPLPAPTNSSIETTFVGRDIAKIKNLYQMSIFPRLTMASQTDVANLAGVPVDDVLLVTSEKIPNDWIERRIESEVDKVCDELAAVKNVPGKKVVTKVGKYSSGNHYYACILKPS